MAFIPPVIDFNFKVSGDAEVLKNFQDARTGVQRTVRSTLEYLARMVAERARSRAPRVTGALAAGVGYRFTMGRSGLSPDEGDRVVIRADIGKGRSGKLKAYATEMGMWGKIKPVKAHQRSVKGNRVRESPYKVRFMKDGKVRSRTMSRTMGGVPVSAYARRFKNRAHPFLGPAGREMDATIREAMTVALPRRLARMLAGESAAA